MIALPLEIPVKTPVGYLMPICKTRICFFLGFKYISVEAVAQEMLFISHCRHNLIKTCDT